SSANAASANSTVNNGSAALATPATAKDVCCSAIPNNVYGTELRMKALRNRNHYNRISRDIRSRENRLAKATAPAPKAQQPNVTSAAVKFSSAILISMKLLPQFASNTTSLDHHPYGEPARGVVGKVDTAPVSPTQSINSSKCLLPYPIRK